ncbi:MAG: hypothetical protein HY762_09030 [Planctomycetes bacterium]|nr:hypothetical protein [Planctomycetota bacterium]
MKLKTLLAVSLLLFAAFASGDDRQSKNDLDYADKLAEEAGPRYPGYFDIAEEICNQFLNSPSKEIKGQAKLILCKILKMKGRAERDVDKRNEYIKKSVQMLEELIRENPDNSDAKFEIAELLLEQAQWLTAVYKIEQDQTKKQQFKQEAEETFNKAIKYLKEMMADYEKRIKAESDETKKEKLEEVYIQASYYYAISYYYYSALYGKAEDIRKQHLRESIRLLRNFTLKYGDLIIAYEAADYCGLCHFELDEYKDAKNYFKVASDGLRNMIEQEEDEAKQKEMLNACKEIIQRCTAHYAMACNANGEYKLAIQTVDNLIKEFPKDASQYWMQMALLEKGWGIVKSGGQTEGMKIVQEIVDANGAAAREAREMTNKMLAELIKGRGKVPFNVLITSIRNLIAKNKFPEAIKQCQMLITSLKQTGTQEDTVKYMPEAFSWMGFAYRSKTPPRFYEAIIAYEAIYSNPLFKNSKDEKGADYWAAIAAYESATAHLQMSTLSGDENDKKQYKDLLKLINKNWPDSQIVQDAQNIIAKELEAEGKYAEAGEAYEKVPQTSPNYITAKFRAGYMYYLQASRKSYPAYTKEKDEPAKAKLKEEAMKYFSLAEQKFKDFMKFAEDALRTSLPEEMRDQIRANDLNSRLFLSRIYLHDFYRKYSEVLNLLKNKESEYSKQPASVGDIYQLKIEALVKLNELEQADTMLAGLIDIANKSNPEIAAPAVQSMSFAWEAIADKIVPPSDNPDARKDFIKRLKKEDFAAFRKAVEKSRAYFYDWTNRSRNVAASEALTVADKLYQSAAEISYPEFYTKAADVYTRLINDEFTGKIPQESWMVTLKMARCYLKLKEWEKAISQLESADKKQSNKIAIIVDLATAYTEAGIDQNSQQYFGLAKKKWAEIVKGTEELTNYWWMGKYYIIFVDYKAGRFTEALNQIRTIKQTVDKDFDHDKFGRKTKFLELEKEIQGKMPGGKQ